MIPLFPGAKSRMLDAVGVWVKKTDVRREKIEMQSGRCFYCARPMTPLGQQCEGYDNLRPTLDHRIPLGRGGRDEASNAVAACQRCNNSKGMMAEDEFRAVLEGRASKMRVPDRVRWERKVMRRNRVPVAILEASAALADAGS